MKVGHQYYLKVCVEEEEDNNILLFRWDTIPEDILRIYNFVSEKSFIDKNNILYGPHIKRLDGRIHALCKFSDTHIGDYVDTPDTIIPRYNAKFFSCLLRNITDKEMKQ